MRLLRVLTRRIDSLNLAQRVALTVGCVIGILLLASALAPPAYPAGGWYGYAPNTSITVPTRPVLYGRLDGSPPWLATLWWLSTDFVATALAVRLLRGPIGQTEAGD